MNNSVYISNRYHKYYQRIAPVFKTQKAQAYTMVILSLFTISFFGVFAIRPTLKTIATLQRQIIDRSEVSQKLEEKINALIAAQETYQGITADIPTIYALLPDKPEVTSLLIKLEQLIDNKNATISAIQLDAVTIYTAMVKPNSASSSAQAASNVLAAEATAPQGAIAVTPRQTGNPNTPINFSVSYKGKYADLVAILIQLTKLDRLITINSAELRLGDTAQKDATLTVGLHSQAYYFPLNL